MANTSIDSERAFVSRKPPAVGARVPDLHAFAHASNLALRHEQLKLVLLRTLRAAGVEFLHLSTFRRVQFVRAVWSEAAASGRASCGLFETAALGALACRAIASGQPEIWDLSSSGAQVVADSTWRKMLFAFNIKSGVTIAIPGADDTSHVFHFGSQDEDGFAEHSSDVGVYGALAFMTSQKLASFERNSPLDGAQFDALLSARELEVLSWCKDGKSYPEIAQILGISAKTVEYHMANAMRKLGVNQKVSAIVAAARQGLIKL